MRKIARIVPVLFCLILVVVLGGYFNTASAVEPPPTEWEMTFGGSGDDEGKSVHETSDGGFIIAGETESFGAGGSDVYLIKTDASGNELWTKTFGGSDDDYGESVHETTDGGFIIVGETESFGAGLYDVYIIKTDASGNELWTKTFGSSAADEGFSVRETTDGGFIIAGQATVFR